MREPTVASVMTTDVITTEPGTTFKDLAALLAGNGISAVPVVADDGTLLGVVSEADLIDKSEFGRDATGPGPLAGRRRRERWLRSRGEIAYTVMTHSVVTIGPDEPVSVAAARMAGANVRRLFVVDAADRLVGVLARRDLLEVFLRADQDILSDVEREVLPRVSWAERRCSAEVVNGVVTLLGSVASRAERELAGRLAAGVPGVVAVHNALDYGLDDATIIAE